ncbi:hypothetical protein BZG02_19775 [Labilibaculum filiforme]|uniref:histidine kinase n=1 Tax=Labilibaculum filiforme TaxID=1940526 RepID=A0A2N3HQL2_9BACT|nr:sensor histidine kinase [Labilibaculum filiforme]PKQ60351.1 hypothetical protein BZG02_19775 [Labilibaculum filiforme]
MKQNTILIQLLALLFLISPIFSFSQENRFINYNVDDGLAQAYVYNILQDSKGNLWIGTGNGLSKYDGYTFRNYTEQDSLGGDFITCSLKTKTGLWFGHLNGRVSFYDGATFRYFINETSSIVDIELDCNENIWIASQNKGFVKLKSESSKENLYQNSFEQPVFTFKFVDENRLLVGTSEGVKLCKITTNKRIEVTNDIDEIPTNKIVDIVKSQVSDIFYILTENDGLYQIKLDSDQYEVDKIATNYDFLRAQTLCEDKNGNLWISSLESGVCKLYISTNIEFPVIEKYNKDNGLQTNSIKSIFEDRAGNVWIGKYGGGISRLVSSANSFINFNEDRYSNSIHSICIKNDIKWIGTGTELLKVDSKTNKVLQAYDVNGILENEKITALADWNDKELWIGTEKSGIYRLNYATEKIKPQFLRLGNLEKSINAIVSEKQYVWIATQKGLCRYKVTSDEKKWYTMQEEGLPHNSVNHLIKDHKGRIWVGTLSNTLSYIQNDELTNIRLANRNSLLNISSVLEDHNGLIWVGTQGNGVYVLNKDSIMNINYQHGLLSDYCYSLNRDENHVWATHRGGISQIRLSDYHVKTFQKNAGINSSIEFNKNATAIGEENTLLFGSNQGIYTYAISKEVANVVPPNLEISSLRVNGDEYPINKNLVLPSGHYKIQIGFKGINLNEPELIKYQYVLNGYEQEWSNPDNKRVAEYKQLGSGTYNFQLNATNSNGIKSVEPLNFKIKIKYPLWQKTWFQIVSFISLMVAIYITVILREKNLKRIQRNLIKNLDDKTREVIAKEEVIKERKRTEKELILAKEKAEESDRLKTAFLSNMSHEIRTPLNAIIGFSGMLQEPDINPVSKSKYISILRSNTNDLLSLIDDIMDVSSIEAGQLKIKIQECNLHEILTELYTVHVKKLSELKLENVVLNYLEKDTNLIIQSDPLRLKQILSNLIGNAIKFTENGSIDFGIVYHKNGIVKFFVKDTGIGIFPDQKEVIFERFRKESRDNWKKLYRGAGLGLAISKSMVSLLGGKIGVESVPGEGSYFYFTLPAGN